MSILITIFGQRRWPFMQREAKRLAERQQIEEYVAGELRKAVPSGWRVIRHDRQRLWWTIEKVSIPPGEWPGQDFSLLVSEDLQWFMLTHGNKDCGVWGLWHALLDAMVISADSLQLPYLTGDKLGPIPRFQLSECVTFVIEHRKPNEWGYT